MIQNCLNCAHYRLKGVLLCFYGSMLIALFAQISVPVSPVPFTLQTLAFLLVARQFGPKHGACAALLYLTEGICGIPVFANFSSGVSVLLSPSGGYLLGAVPAIFLTGILIQRMKNKKFVSIFLAGLSGEIVVFLWGYLRLSNFVGFYDAYLLGVAPFLFTDLLKLTVFSLYAREK
ncbi:MAG: biotin transporter BioY [Holosporaceae bacterium]|nr:biotin transporter BioY [Holosporaceae bacterium]